MAEMTDPVERDWEAARRRFVDAHTDDVTDGQRGDESADGTRFGPLAVEFAELSRRLFTAESVAGVLEEIVHAAKHVIPEADMVSVTLRHGEDDLSTPAATDPAAIALDQMQYDAQEGPCVEATRRTGTGVAADADLAASTQWPQFGPAAAAEGWHSVLSFGLFPTADPPRFGALNLYAGRPHAFAATDLDLALVLAAHAAAALATARSFADAELRTTNLTRALTSHDVVGQAKGVLMERRGIAPDEAFDILRRTSQDLNLKLIRVAEELLASFHRRNDR